jgi:hypothetical protein
VNFHPVFHSLFYLHFFAFEISIKGFPVNHFINHLNFNIMEVITISTEAFRQIIESINEINQKLDSKINTNPLQDTWLDIQDVCMLLKISKRTLQSYRDQGVLPFSQISGKIYFKACDIQTHLDKHYSKPQSVKR